MLEFDPILMLFTFVLFLILVAVLNKILYQPVLNFMDKRNETIKNDEEKAGQNSDDIDKYLKEANEIIASAKNEAYKIKSDAINEAKSAFTKELETKRNSLEADFNAFCEDLKTQKDNFKNDLLSQLPEFKQILDKKLSQI